MEQHTTNKVYDQQSTAQVDAPVYSFTEPLHHLHRSDTRCQHVCAQLCFCVLLQASHNAEEKLNAGGDVHGESRDAFAVVVLDNQQRASEVRCCGSSTCIAAV